MLQNTFRNANLKKRARNLLRFTIAFLFTSLSLATAQTTQLKIQFPAHTDYEISLQPNAGLHMSWNLYNRQRVPAGSLASFEIPNEILPAELLFTIRYRLDQDTTQYQFDKVIIVSKNTVELEILHVKNAFSFHFKKQQDENYVLNHFFDRKAEQYQKVESLKAFLDKYSDRKSKIYQQAMKEYLVQVKIYNAWVKAEMSAHPNYFANAYFVLQQEIPVDYNLDPRMRMDQYGDRMASYIDLNDSNLLRITEFANFTNRYVNGYALLASTVEQRNALFQEVGQKQVEMAKKVNPFVYGWMTDFFYNGFMQLGIYDGIFLLDAYYQDTNCKTQKRIELEKRYATMVHLNAGSKSPNLYYANRSGESKHNFLDDDLSDPYQVVLFWTADCTHCQQLVNEWYPAYHEERAKHPYSVYAVSLDFTDTELNIYKQYVSFLPDWKHIPTDQGINSQEAMDWGVVSTPTIFVIDPKTKQIVNMPRGFDELQEFFKIQQGE